MIQKSIILVMLSCTGAGYFFGDTDIMGSLPFINSEFHQDVKKKTLPKPKSYYSKRQTSNKNSASTTKQFSFFRVLNDPSLNNMVGLNGEIIKKYNSSPAPVRKVQSGQNFHPKKPTSVPPIQIEKASLKIAVPRLSPFMPKKAAVDTGRTKAPGPASRWSLDNTGSSGTLAVNKLALRGGVGMVSYVVQVSSFRQWQKAEILRAALVGKGYAAFIGKTKLLDNRGTWYRVYIGRYFNRVGAKMAAERFYREENRQAMVIRQTR